jgi:hypothetical protein
LIEESLALEYSRQGHRIAGLVALDESRGGAEDQPVVIAVEIIGVDPVGDLVPGGRIDHQAAENRLLGLDRMRRQPQTIVGRAGGRIEAASGHVQSLRAAALPAATLRRRW